MDMLLQFNLCYLYTNIISLYPASYDTTNNSTMVTIAVNSYFANYRSILRLLREQDKLFLNFKKQIIAILKTSYYTIYMGCYPSR